MNRSVPWENDRTLLGQMSDLRPTAPTETVKTAIGAPIDGVFGAMIDSKQVRKRRWAG